MVLVVEAPSATRCQDGGGLVAGDGDAATLIQAVRGPGVASQRSCGRWSEPRWPEFELIISWIIGFIILLLLLLFFALLLLIALQLFLSILLRVLLPKIESSSDFPFSNFSFLVCCWSVFDFLVLFGFVFGFDFGFGFCFGLDLIKILGLSIWLVSMSSLVFICIIFFGSF